MAALTKRMVIRLGDELEAWIGERAEREGLDNAAWVRSLLTKMMNGLVAMPRDDIARRLVTAQDDRHPQTGIDPDQSTNSTDALLESRVEEAAESAAPPLFVTPPPAADDLSHELVGPAYPLRRFERVRYNPGRGGYG